MADKQSRASDALTAQGRSLHRWLAELSANDFAAPSVLPGWDVRTLVGHLALVVSGFDLVLGRPTTARPVPAWELVRRYRRDVSEARVPHSRGHRRELGSRTRGAVRCRSRRVAERLAGPLPTAIDPPVVRPPCSTSPRPGSSSWPCTATICRRSLPDREPVPTRARRTGIDRPDTRRHSRRASHPAARSRSGCRRTPRCSAGCRTTLARPTPAAPPERGRDRRPDVPSARHRAYVLGGRAGRPPGHGQRPAAPI